MILASSYCKVRTFFNRLLQLDVPREILSVTGAIVWLTVCSQLSIPLRPVPVTLQTFGVFVWAMASSSPIRSFRAVASWILCGVMGIPCFAYGCSGIDVLSGPWGGHVMGMLVAAPLITWISRLKESSRFMKLGAGMVGAFLILCIGFSWLAYTMGDYGFAWTAGVQPFFLGEALKVLMASSLVIIGNQWIKRA